MEINNKSEGKNYFQILVDNGLIWMYIGELISADNNLTNKEREENIQKLTVLKLGLSTVQGHEKDVKKALKILRGSIRGLKKENEDDINKK